LALGAAVSPGLLAFELLILASDRQPKARAWCYFLGVLSVIGVCTMIGIAIVRAVLGSVDTLPIGLVVGAKALLAMAFALVGIAYLRPLRQDGALVRWEARLRRAGLAAFYGVGIATMMTNWSTIVLYLTALDVVRRAADPVAVRAVASILILLITVAPLLLPVLAVTMVGHRSDPMLARLNAFTTRYARQLNAGIFLLVAAVFACSAMTDLI
jgi:hypothetical protein